jgi:hypothetical protein
VAQTVEGSSPNGEMVRRRSAPVDTDVKLQLFPVPERGMGLLVADSPAGEGELRRQLASAPVEPWRRHDTKPRQR